MHGLINVKQKVDIKMHATERDLLYGSSCNILEPFVTGYRQLMKVRLNM